MYGGTAWNFYDWTDATYYNWLENSISQQGGAFFSSIGKLAGKIGKSGVVQSGISGAQKVYKHRDDIKDFGNLGLQYGQLGVDIAPHAVAVGQLGMTGLQNFRQLLPFAPKPQPMIQYGGSILNKKMYMGALNGKTSDNLKTFLHNIALEKYMDYNGNLDFDEWYQQNGKRYVQKIAQLVKKYKPELYAAYKQWALARNTALKMFGGSGCNDNKSPESCNAASGCSWQAGMKRCTGKMVPKAPGERYAVAESHNTPLLSGRQKCGANERWSASAKACVPTTKYQSKPVPIPKPIVDKSCSGDMRWSASAKACVPTSKYQKKADKSILSCSAYDRNKTGCEGRAGCKWNATRNKCETPLGIVGLQIGKQLGKELQKKETQKAIGEVLKFGLSGATTIGKALFSGKKKEKRPDQAIVDAFTERRDYKGLQNYLAGFQKNDQGSNQGFNQGSMQGFNQGSMMMMPMQQPQVSSAEVDQLRQQIQSLQQQPAKPNVTVIRLDEAQLPSAFAHLGLPAPQLGGGDETLQERADQLAISALKNNGDVAILDPGLAQSAQIFEANLDDMGMKVAGQVVDPKGICLGIIPSWNVESEHIKNNPEMLNLPVGPFAPLNLVNPSKPLRGVPIVAVVVKIRTVSDKDDYPKLSDDDRPARRIM